MLPLLAQIAWSSDALTFFNNWFVTGDYAVAGVGLRGTGVKGWATGTINMSGVPSGAQPIAAFLYWSTVETTSTPGGAVGYFNGNEIQGLALGNPQSPNPPCWSSSNGVEPAKAAGFVYRADVLRYLPVNSSNIAQANGKQTVKLPDTTGGTVLYTNGASLVVIYKVVTPGFPYIAPLRAVVIYNGAYTMTNKTAGMSLNVYSFYQTSVNPAPRITNIVANGESSFSSSLSVNGTSVSGNPFVGAQGTRWDNPTYNFNLPANASSFPTLATTSNSQTCLTWAAIVTSVGVQDTDGDGLLDIWEKSGLHRNTQVSPATFGTCAQYPSDPCVNLPAMGANPLKQDIFIQMDWMHGTGDGTGGIDGRGTHDHIPPLASLSTVASTFGIHQINVHFDVGNNYQGTQSACNNATCSFIIQEVAGPQGGHDDAESTLVCQSTATHKCDYNEPYPVLSFEYGFDSIRDGNSLLGIPAHFAQNRRDAFHYMLFAHALGGPYDQNGNPINPFTLAPATTPLTYSGIAHRPGGGFMVTFGLWRSDNPAYDQVGSPGEVARTIQHELGHNLDLGHAGTQTQPNCMPNYPSVMNYLYQITGLLDASGNAHSDYSYGLLLPLSENLLNTSIPMSLPGLQLYEVSYFGPLGTSHSATQAATVYCDGAPLKNGAPAEIKSHGTTIATPDWSNGTVALGKLIPPEDLNHDGTMGQVFLDQPDWFILNLQQIGTGYIFGGLSVGAFATDGGAFATDGGAFATDAGSLATQAGAFATDGGAFATDGGAFATDGGAFATDGGAFATDGGAFATDAGELDEVTVLCTGGSGPPTNVTPSLGTNSVTGAGNSIVVKWTSPETGANLTYNLYRCAGAGCTPALFKTGITGLSYPDTINDNAHGGTATQCQTNTCANTTYFYQVTAVATLICGGVTSKPESQRSTPPVSFEVPTLFVVATSNTLTYDGNNHSLAFQIFGDYQANLTPAPAITCPSYRNAGTYSNSVCSGPNPVTATTNAVIYVAGGATYTDGAGAHTGGTLKINTRAITVTAAFSTKIYNASTAAGTISSSSTTIATPTITTGSLGTGDSVTWTETYDSPNVNPVVGSHVMTPAGTVSDGNGGNNYTVTFLKSAATSVITPAPLSASITGNPSRPYNGTTAAALTSANFSLSGLQGSDGFTVTQTVGTYNSANVATATTVTAALAAGNFTPVSPTLATNYTLPTTASGPGSITAVTLTASIIGNPTKPYDGTATATLAPANFSIANLVGTESFTVTQTAGTYNSPNVATATTVTASLTSGNFTALGSTIATNYVLPTTASGPGSITAVTLTASIIGNPTKPYDGTATATLAPANFSIAHLVGTESFTVTQTVGTYSGPNVVNVPPTTVSATLTGSNLAPGAGTLATNYNLPTTASGPGSITPAPSTTTVTCPPGPYTYNGSAQTPCSATVTGAGSLSLTPTPSYSNNINAGLATASYTYAGDANHTGSSGLANFTINQAPSTTTVTCPPGPYTYNGSAQTPCTATVTGAGALSLTPTPSYSNNINAGLATASYTYAGDANHTGSSGSANFTINQATPTVTDSGPAPTAPDYGQPVTLTVTVAPPQSGEVPTGTVTFSFTLNSITNYICSNGTISTTTPACTVGLTPSNGNYIASVTTSTLPTAAENVVATYSGDPNFVGETANPNPVSVTVSQASSAVTLTKSTDPSTYGQSVNLTVDVVDNTRMSVGVPTGTVTLSFLLDPTVPSGQVYYICADGSVVTAACANPITLAPDPMNPSGATATVPTSALPAGLATFANPGANPPTPYSYPINATYSGDTNFAPSAPFGLSQTVNQLSLTATAGSYSGTYNGSPQSPSACVVTPISPNTITGTLTCTNSTTSVGPGAGSGTVTPVPSVAPGDSLNNYAITSVNGSWNIAKANATITVAPYNVTYNGSPYTATGSATGVNSTNLTSGLSLSGTIHTNAGGYGSDPWTFTDTTGNYNNASGTVSDTIGQYPLTVTATGVNKNFDGTTNATVTLSDNRISLSDTFTDSYTSATFASIGPGSGISVNVNGISIAGAGAANYTLTSTTAMTTANINDTITLSALALNGSSALTGSALQLTSTGSETASAWLGTAIPVISAFQTTFQFEINPASSTDTSIGDGFAFVIQGAPTGSATLGTTGLGMYIGYDGIPNSIAIEFDTYYNPQYGDPEGPHIGIQSNGAGANSPDHTSAAKLATPVQATFANGSSHTATVTYDGSSIIRVYLDGASTAVVSATVTGGLSTFLGLGGGPAYVGFTAATGSASETPDISNWTWNY
jgi:Legume lectin domain/Bacterial Ig-like domain (group 3)/YDG domain